MIQTDSDVSSRQPVATRKGLSRWGRPLLACLLCTTAGIPAWAQEAPAGDNTILVIGARPLDSTVERSLDAADVTAYGADSIGEVLDEITAESGDTADEVVLLVNGRRVSGLGEIEDLPAEVVSEIGVLPPGSGREVGGNSTQRVYNVVLRRSADIGTARVGWRTATEGGWNSRYGGLSFTHVRGPRRLNATVRVRDDDILLESERDVVQPASAGDEAAFRSLAPEMRRWDVGLSAADQLAQWLHGSLAAKASTTDSLALLGKGPDSALQQARRNDALGLEASLNANAGSWLIAAFGEYRFERRRADTDRIVASQPLLLATRSQSTTASGLLLATGPVFSLPSGPVRLSLGAGIDRETIDGERNTGGAAAVHISALTTKTLSAGLEIPLASAKRGVLPFLGELVAGVDYSRLSVGSYDGFDNWTYSLNWRPVDRLRFNFAVTRGSTARSLLLLDEPVIETPGVRYFDPVLGETTTVTRLSGGLLGLPPSSTRTTKVGASFKPVPGLALQLTSEYLATDNRNVVTDLPPASAAIIAAFPERFVRDGSGRLVQVDARPVVLASRNQRQLRSGFTLSLPLGSRSGAPGPAAAGDDAGNESEQRGSARPRLQLAASHTWLLESGVVIRPGEAAIDLLSPAAIGFGGLGQPRHRVTFSLGYAERGFGVRLSGQHRSASTLEARGSTANVLRFAPLTTVNARAWIDGARLFPSASIMKGTRLTLSVQNITGVRETVRDQSGVTPLAYQLVYREPIGRTVMLELRKTF